MSLRKEDVDKLVKQVVSKNIIKKQVLCFDLPSEYLGSKTKTEVRGQTVQEVRKFDPKISVSEIRSFRKRFYSVLHRVSYKTILGWVIAEGADLSELYDVIGSLNSLVANNHMDRKLKIVEIWIPSDFLEEEITKNIQKLSMDYRRLRQKIKEAKGKLSKVHKLQKQIEEVEKEIVNLENELKFLKAR
jgi:polyhydroxyalkanoate synthesis regulator phasin